MREQDIQRRILTELKRRDIYAVKVITANRNGVPDILCCVAGQFVGIEVKTPQGRVSPVQKAHQQWIKDAGGYSLVARSWDDVKEFLHERLGQSGGNTVPSVHEKSPTGVVIHS